MTQEPLLSLAAAAAPAPGLTLKTLAEASQTHRGLTNQTLAEKPEFDVGPKTAHQIWHMPHGTCILIVYMARQLP